jgi:hypothetical protein
MEMMMADDFEQFVKEWAQTFPRFYSTSKSENHTQKNLKDWTSNDLKKVESRDLDVIRQVMESEHYKYIDPILPNSMNRAEFARAVLRESARRGEIAGMYLHGFGEIKGFDTQRIVVTRTAFGTANALPEKVVELAGVIAIRDAGINMITTDVGGIALQDDVSRELGRPSSTQGKPIETDAQAFDFGYTVGAMPQFKKDDALHVRVNLASAQETQAKYCPDMKKLFQEGRAHNNSTAVVLGFMQARIDAKQQFESGSDRIGLFAECPSTPKANKANVDQRKTATR